MRCILLIICVLIGFLWPESGAQAGQSHLTRYNLMRTYNGNEVQLYLSSPAKYEVFTLSQPPRVVIDIENASWAAKNALLPNSGGLLKEFRHAKTDDGNLRVVIETTKPVYLSKDNIELKGNRAVLSIAYSSKKPGKSSSKNKPASLNKTYHDKNPFAIPGFKMPGLKEYPKKAAEIKKPKPLEKAKGLTLKSKKPIPTSKPKYAKHNSRRPIIMIDPGHGGRDPGAIGSRGTKEKSVTFAYAKMLAQSLKASGNYIVYLTRTKDKYIKLQDRITKAQRVGADLFLSIHADSHNNKNTRGFSVYTLAEHRAKREENKLLKKAKSHEVIRGVDLRKESKDVQGILIGMAQRETSNASSTFAKMIVKEVGSRASLLKRPKRFGSFAVLTSVDIPSALVELGYLSNYQEERLLKQSRYKKKIVGALKRAIDLYFLQNPV